MEHVIIITIFVLLFSLVVILFMTLTKVREKEQNLTLTNESLHHRLADCLAKLSITSENLSKSQVILMNEKQKYALLHAAWVALTLERTNVRSELEKAQNKLKQAKTLIQTLRNRQKVYKVGLTRIKLEGDDINVLKCRAREELSIILQNDGLITFDSREWYNSDYQAMEEEVSAKLVGTKLKD